MEKTSYDLKSISPTNNMAALAKNCCVHTNTLTNVVFITTIGRLPASLTLAVDL